MRKSIVILATLLFISLLPSLAMSQEGVQGHIELSQAIVEQIGTVLDANNVLGDPVIVQGKTIIPVVSMAFGFGSGRGMMEMHTGSGGGGGGIVMPVSMMVISRDGEITILEARKNQFTEMIKGLSLAYMEIMKEHQKTVDGE